MFEAFLGNDKLKNEIEQLIISDALPHGIIIQGDEGQGCGFFADLLAEAYLGDMNGLVARGIHPDCITVLGAGSSGEIPVQSVRDALFEANKAAVMTEGKRVILIKNAEMLNQSSSNALLKMLEEPPKGVIFILTVKKDTDLLPTILSRSVIYRIHSPGIDLCEIELQRRVPGCSEENAKEVAELFDGNIGLSLKALTDGNYSALSIAGREFCKAALDKNIFKMMKWLAEAEDRDSLRTLLHSSVLWLKGSKDRLNRKSDIIDSVITEISEAYEEAGKYTNIKIIQARLVYKLGGNR